MKFQYNEEEHIGFESLKENLRSRMEQQVFIQIHQNGELLVSDYNNSRRQQIPTSYVLLATN